MQRAREASPPADACQELNRCLPKAIFEVLPSESMAMDSQQELSAGLQDQAQLLDRIAPGPIRLAPGSNRLASGTHRGMSCFRTPMPPHEFRKWRKSEAKSSP